MVNLKNQPAYYITIKANRNSEIKTLYAGEDHLGLAGFFIDFDKARRFSCPVSAEKWFKFHFLTKKLFLLNIMTGQALPLKSLNSFLL